MLQPPSYYTQVILSLSFLCVYYIASVDSAAADIYGIPTYVTPYGPQNFNMPAPSNADLPPQPKTQPLAYSQYVRAQKDCAHFIYQVKRLANSVTQPNTGIWFNKGNITNNTLAASLFSKNVSSRIGPLGVFPNYELTVQYYYALPLYWFQIIAIVLDHMTCVGNVVSFRSTLMLSSSQNASQWNMIQFDHEGKIKTLDGLFYNLGGLFDKFIYTPSGIELLINNETTDLDAISYIALNFTSNTTSRLTFPGGTYTYNLQSVDMICQVTSFGYSKTNSNQMKVPGGTCQGANAIWNNSYGLSQYDYCMNWIQQKVPYGSWNWGSQNNTVCRLIHMQLTYFYPTLHCPHVGFGGNFCKDYPYSDYFPPMPGNVQNF